MHNTLKNIEPRTDTLEARMRIALNRLLAVSQSGNGESVRLSYDINSEPGHSFYARIGNADEHFAFASTPEEAAEKVIAVYGSAESRRIAQIEKLKAEAAKLGCTINEASTSSE